MDYHADPEVFGRGREGDPSIRSSEGEHGGIEGFPHALGAREERDDLYGDREHPVSFV